jgi:hypothetical protein
MPTVVQAFDKFLHNLELTEQERAEASQHGSSLGESLNPRLGGVNSHFLAGSFGRGVAIRPLLDIPLFVVLDASTHSGLREAGPMACLETIQRALLEAAPPDGAPPRIEGRAVNHRPSGATMGYDVIPAFTVDDGVYLIPDRQQRGWIKTAPEAAKRASANAHEKAGAKLHPLIRAAKHWNERSGRPLLPFHLEALAEKAVPTPPLNYLDAIRQLFARAAESVMRDCPDPAGVGPNIDEGISREQRTRAQIAIKEALRQVDHALQCDRSWRIDEAHGVFRRFFGEAYPATGRR